MTPTGDSSPLLWLMAAVVAMLAAYLFIGWIRRGRAAEGWRQMLGPMLGAGLSLGVGLTASVLLSIAAEALPFPLGYRWIWAGGLLGASLLVGLPLAWALLKSQRLPVLIVCGLLLSAMAMAMQAGWILSAGLRPGLRWQPPMMGVAAAVMAIGFSAALWLAYSDASGDGARKTLWRVGAAVLMALSLVTGQELVLNSAGLLAQVGSIYQREASSTWLTLFAGAVVPVVLGMLTLDLALRNHADRRRSKHAQPLDLQKRRKRRRKYRTL